MQKMNGQKVDDFSARLTRELNSLSWQDRNDLLIRIGRAELRMRAHGQERPFWRGPAPVPEMLGADVVVPTESGERRGRVICFGVTQMPDGIDYERSVIVHVPSSGTHHEAPASLARLASPEDQERMANEVEMARRLSEVNEVLQSTPTPLAVAKPKKRGEKDPKLIASMLEAAKNSAKVRSVEEGGSNYKITGADPKKRVYLFKNQLRVDISGVTVDHPAIRKISEQEAKDMHLGKVRGQLIFDDRESALAGFCEALERLA